MTDSGFSASDIVETVISLPTPGGVFDVLDAHQFRLKAINQAALSLIQAPSAAVNGRMIKDLQFSPNAAISLETMARRCTESAASETFEESFVLRDGSTVHLSITWVPSIEANRVTQLIFTATNITELVNNRRQRSRELALLASGFLRTCAWCGDVDADGEWVPASSYVESTGPINETRCPDCR